MAQPGESRVPLQDEDVYWVGQHLGVVVAETFEQVTHAASLVRVQYQAKPPLVSLAGANPVQPEKFIGRERLQAKRGDVDGALATASHRVDVVYSTPIENHNPIETTSTTVEWEGSDRLLIHESTRGIKQLQKIVANALGLSRENVHVLFANSSAAHLARKDFNGVIPCSQRLVETGTATGEAHFHATTDV